MARAPRAAVVEPVPAPAPAPAVPEAPVVVQSVPDPFDIAFAEAAAAAAEADPRPSTVAPPKKPAPPPEATPQPVEPPAAAAPQPPESQPAQPPAPAPVEPLAPEPVAAPPPPPPPQPQPQPQPQLQQPEPQPQPRAPYQEPPLFNAEEVTQLQQFYTDWPDVARATETMVKGIMTQTVRRMYADMAASLAPYFRTIDTLADRSQLSELQEQVSDYDTVASQLTTWARNQPAYLRSAYEHVIKSGTAAEVVDLINRYKSDMQSTQAPAQGTVQPVPAAPAAAAAAPAPAPAPVSPALAAAAARLAPVATKRTNVVAPPTDFDSAFAEFAKAS